MKGYGNSNFKRDKFKARQRHNEQKSGGFKCSHCKQFVVINGIMGTANRNHCNICLWSKHVDDQKGDRRAMCQGGMEPIGLTLKHEGYGTTGEIMLIHLCSLCQKISINRIARDDPEHTIMKVFRWSYDLGDVLKSRLSKQGINLIAESDDHEVTAQLFGA